MSHSLLENKSILGKMMEIIFNIDLSRLFMVAKSDIWAGISMVRNKKSHQARNDVKT